MSSLLLFYYGTQDPVEAIMPIKSILVWDIHENHVTAFLLDWPRYEKTCYSHLGKQRHRSSVFNHLFSLHIDKENPSLVFSGDREIPTRGSTVRRVSHWNGGPEGLDIPVTLYTNDRFYFLHI